MNRALLVLALVSPAGLLSAVGCYGSYCDENPENCNGDSGGSGGGTTTATMTTTSSSMMSTGGGGEGGSIPASCVPSMLSPGEAVPADCGVFVASGATGSGTPADPTGDLAQALANVEN